MESKKQRSVPSVTERNVKYDTTYRESIRVNFFHCVKGFIKNKSMLIIIIIIRIFVLFMSQHLPSSNMGYFNEVVVRHRLSNMSILKGMRIQLNLNGSLKKINKWMEIHILEV
jgi:hypothetical protein